MVYFLAFKISDTTMYVPDDVQNTAVSTMLANGLQDQEATAFIPVYLTCRSYS